MNSEEEFWFWLNTIPGIGRKTIDKLLEQFGSPQKVYETTEKEWKRCLTASQLDALVRSRNPGRVREQLKRLSDRNIIFMWQGHPGYPKRLLQLFDAPYGLYLKGSLPREKQRTIAVVGARNADDYGRELAFYFSRELAGAGIGVISGLAYGVDGQAHRGALEVGGYTLGILGSGINICYPKENYRLYGKLAQNGGIMSEYGLDIAPKPGLFPVRNRLIAAMADGILVVQARKKSGSLITVDQGLELGRDIFALPGRVGDELCEGCNQMIQSGAKLVTKVEDILEEWGEISDNSPSFQIHSKNTLVKIEKMVYSVMRLEPKHVDAILEETGLTIAQLIPVLMQLEQQGYIRQVGQNYFSVAL
ncbi:MAG: DNA-processing protein DprA [Lachnospiraceae bacterium]|nr:DNA-processing protein DprA [Lachnospiraceae bacterium]